MVHQGADHHISHVLTEDCGVPRRSSKNPCIGAASSAYRKRSALRRFAREATVDEGHLASHCTRVPCACLTHPFGKLGTTNHGGHLSCLCGEKTSFDADGKCCEGLGAPFKVDY
jgi:hypothetical protein